MIKYDAVDGDVRYNQLINLRENPNKILILLHSKEAVKKTGSMLATKQVNLANGSQNSQKLDDMESLLLSEMKKLKDSYRYLDQPQDYYI
mgnify:FL=1